MSDDTAELIAELEDWSDDLRPEFTDLRQLLDRAASALAAKDEEIERLREELAEHIGKLETERQQSDFLGRRAARARSEALTEAAQMAKRWADKHPVAWEIVDAISALKGAAE